MKDLSNPTNKELDKILDEYYDGVLEDAQSDSNDEQVEFSILQRQRNTKTAISKLLEKQDIKSRIDECQKVIKRQENKTGKSSIKVLMKSRINYLASLSQSNEVSNA